LCVVVLNSSIITGFFGILDHPSHEAHELLLPLVELLLDADGPVYIASNPTNDFLFADREKALSQTIHPLKRVNYYASAAAINIW